MTTAKGAPAKNLSEQTAPPKQKGTWKKGQSGNPGGRPVGIGWHAEMRLKLREAVTPVFASLFKAAIAGDTKASAILLERVLPPLRSGDDPVQLPATAASLATQAHQVMAMIAAGTLTPSVGAELLTALGSVSRIVESSELEERIAQLEAASP